MATYLVVMINFAGTRVDSSTVERVLDPCKDWLKFSSQNWLIYTDLSAQVIRDRLVEAFEPEMPNLLVLPSELESWSVFAGELSRNWLKKDRSPNLKGE